MSTFEVIILVASIFVLVIGVALIEMKARE